MRIREVPFLLWYSAKSILWTDPKEVVVSLKNPRTWSYILYATVIISVWYGWYTMLRFSLPLLALTYIVVQHNEPSYHKALRRHAFLKNDREFVMKEYLKHLRYCKYNKKEPLPIEEFRRQEIEKEKASP